MVFVVAVFMGHHIEHIKIFIHKKLFFLEKGAMLKIIHRSDTVQMRAIYCFYFAIQFMAISQKKMFINEKKTKLNFD